jgi:hypothetical protein
VLTVLALCLATAGCMGENSLSLTLPDGSEVGKNQSIKVEAKVVEAGSSPEDGSEVTFTTTKGSFEPYDRSQTPDAVQETTVDTTGGKAEVTLYDFPGQGGAGEVTASYFTINEITVEGKANVTVFGGPHPSGKSLQASCDTQNASVWANAAERGKMRIRCSVTVKDISGLQVPKATVTHMVENGCALSPVEDSDAGDGTYVFALTPDCDPMDLEPTSGEPNHTELGKIRNPLDGLLTIVFLVAKGEEGFVDADGDGVYDAGEGFVGNDLGEPYVDQNDNGQWDNGEPFGDVDKNGTWSAANGKWDGETTIWAATRILFSGKPHESGVTTRVEPSGINIPDRSSQQLTLFLMDINHNPIAANDESDAADFTVVNATLTSPASGSVELENTMGVEFTEAGNVIPESFNRHRSYSITLADNDPSTTTQRQVTLSTTVSWTEALDFDSYSPAGQSVDLGAVTGTSN